MSGTDSCVEACAMPVTCNDEVYYKLKKTDIIITPLLAGSSFDKSLTSSIGSGLSYILVNLIELRIICSLEMFVHKSTKTVTTEDPDGKIVEHNIQKLLIDNIYTFELVLEHLEYYCSEDCETIHVSRYVKTEEKDALVDRYNLHREFFRFDAEILSFINEYGGQRSSTLFHVYSRIEDKLLHKLFWDCISSPYITYIDLMLEHACVDSECKCEKPGQECASHECETCTDIFSHICSLIKLSFSAPIGCSIEIRRMFKNPKYTIWTVKHKICKFTQPYRDFYNDGHDYW